MYKQLKGDLSMAVKIQKWGNSQGIRLPKYLLEGLNWKENEQLTIKAEEGKLVIEKMETKRKNIKELFDNFEGEYVPTQIDWGEPEGKEIW